MTQTPSFHVAVGDTVTFAKTVGETDVYQFAGITGDLAPMHVNESFMEASAYGHRIAHGALLVGYMSTTATMMCARFLNAQEAETPVSLGYDRIRFTGPVYFGDTITVRYTISAIDIERRRAEADVAVTNQSGATVAVATHLIKWVANQPA